MSEFNIRTAFAKLRVEHVVSYCLAKEWTLAEPEQDGKILLLGEEFEGGQYELLLPADGSLKNGRVQLQRSIYKLCGIEEREPAEILREVFATFEESNRSAESVGQTLKVRNSGSQPMTIQVTSNLRDRELLPGEALELRVQMPPGKLPELEQRDGLLIIRDR